MENFRILDKGRFIIRNKFSKTELTSSDNINDAKRIAFEFQHSDRMEDAFEDNLYEIYDDSLGITID